MTTDWVAEHLDDPAVRIIESNEDQLLYRSGHLPGAVEVDWVRDLNDQVRRDYLDNESFSKLCSRIGIVPETLLVFYGDKSNWWACYALWIFRLFGHTKSAIMDGGRLKWEQTNRPMTREIPSYRSTAYPLRNRDDQYERALKSAVLSHVEKSRALIDVRSEEEFTGQRLHMENYPNEGALRGGHIPGAKNVPWSKSVNPVDGTFLPLSELRRIYEDEIGLRQGDDVIAYCRIGERSSHTWFVLKMLLGFPNVRNYDGSWTEWGNSVGVPIEK